MTNEKVTLEGAYNFRDFGGYRTKEGKYVVTGKLYRSDELRKLLTTVMPKKEQTMKTNPLGMLRSFI